MTKAELLRILEQYDDDAEIRLMTQESWPFENSVYGAWSPEDSEPAEAEDEQEEDDPFRPGDNADGHAIVYLVEGSQIGYGDKRAWQEAERW